MLPGCSSLASCCPWQANETLSDDVMRKRYQIQLEDEEMHGERRGRANPNDFKGVCVCAGWRTVAERLHR